MNNNDELLTTGQAAAFLGTTRQHIVNLCLRGELPCTMAGTHRRIRRAAALALAGRPAANKGGRLTDDQIRLLWLHRVAAGHVARDPERSLRQARDRLVHSLGTEPSAVRWVRQWLDYIDQGPEAVMRVMTSTDPLARELRQNSPFLGLLPERERRSVLEAFHRTSYAGRRPPSALAM